MTVRAAGVLDASLPIKVSLGFAAAVVMVGAAGWFDYRSDLETRDSANWVAHTLTVQATLEALGARVADAEAGARGYALTGSPSFLEPYDSARGSVPTLARALRSLTIDNPTQQRRLDRLEPLVAAKFTHLSRLIAVRRRSGVAGGVRFVGTGQGRRLMGAIRGEIAEMETEERRLLVLRTAGLATNARRSGRIDIAASVLAIGVIGAALFVILADLRALRHAQAQVKTLTGLLPMCSNCKKIRDDRGEWHHVEVYVESRSSAEFSHGVCPDCARQLYGEYYEPAPDT